MVNKKTMSVHNSAHLFIVNTADVPLTYRSPSASTLILSGIAPKSSGRESLKYYTHNYTTGLSHILIT